MEDAVRQICERIENKIDDWKVSEKSSQKDFDPPWTPEQREWHNNGVESVKDMIESMRKGDL